MKNGQNNGLVLSPEGVASLDLIRNIIRADGLHAFYCDGMIILDLEKIADFLYRRGFREEIAIVRECEWIVRHELGHAIQLEATGDSDEAFAEAFAEKYGVRRRNLFQKLSHRIRMLRRRRRQTDRVQF